MLWLPIRQRVQSELLKRGHCVGCTRSLAAADRQDHPHDRSLQIVACSCRRVYLYDKRINAYVRALPQDINV